MTAETIVWQPLLTGEARDRAHAAIDELTPALAAVGDYHLGWDEDPSLARFYAFLVSSGRPGVAVAFSYLGRRSGRSSLYAVAEQLLDATLEELSSTEVQPSLYSGAGGTAWTLAHLERIGIIEAFDADWSDALTDFDELLVTYAGSTTWQSQYDLINGLVGLGVYALERWPRATAVDCLQSIIEHLAELAEVSDEGAAWFTPPELMLDQHSRDRFPRGCYELGVAHGVAGVVAFLATVHHTGLVTRQVEELLQRATAWLLRQRKDRPFPYPREIGRDGTLEFSRASWCNGSIGIAVALLKAAETLNDSQLRRAAIDLALSTSRYSPETTRVVDACLCHGSAGLAHMLNRMYQTTREEPLREAALRWYDTTLRFRRAGAGIGGYLFGNSRGGTGVADPGFLMGAAGVTLALVAAVDAQEPEWDRLMLLEMPPRLAAATT